MALRLWVNGRSEEVVDGLRLEEFLAARGVARTGLAVAVNGRVLRPGENPELREGDRLELVRAVAGGERDEADRLHVAGTPLRSRLFLGTGKYPDEESMRRALEAAEPGLVTVAVRAMNPGRGEQSLLDAIDLRRYRLLPNTAGSTSASQAVHMAELARVATGTEWIKLEIVGDPRTLWPDTAATVEATRELVRQGFVVLAYTSPDLVAALRLEEAGAAAVMPLASPIGTGQGFQDWAGLRRIIERIQVPVVIDAGLGVPSEAARAMEMGADAVLVNSAVAYAGDPAAMALAFRLAVEAGRRAFLAGRMPVREEAVPSSPTRGLPSPGGLPASLEGTAG
ncbi:MAG: sulfur carrier protein ThiS [Bacillota bacterium]|nr:sulfur carrier protein ThiS [Bacillota bacterium]